MTKRKQIKASPKKEAATVTAKYVFLDIVGYTHNRSVEAQSDLVAYLNDIVDDALSTNRIPKEDLVLLPTGDGMCISIVSSEMPYDIHILLAKEILHLLEKHNEKTVDEMRKFQIRIGINANLDNFVTDINGKRNIAGAGISMAQRVMSSADGNQILVGQQVYETLRYREKYRNSFRQFEATIKHGIKLLMYQYVDQNFTELNCDIPSQFIENIEERSPANQPMPTIVAHYLVQAILHREDLKRHASNKTDHATLTILLWFLANDAREASRATDTDPHEPATWGAGKASFEQQYKHYDEQDFHLQQTLEEFLVSKLEPFDDCFEESMWLPHQFVSEEGATKLRSEYPALWKTVESHWGRKK